MAISKRLLQKNTDEYTSAAVDIENYPVKSKGQREYRSQFRAPLEELALNDRSNIS